MKLNKEQAKAEVELLKFLQDPKEKLICVIGPGGSGKSHSVVNFVKNHWSKLGAVVLSAPTNAATGVLANFANKVGKPIPSKTIHQVLGLVLGSNGETKRSFRAHDGCFDLYKTIVLDEGSMAGAMICDSLEERMFERSEVKIIVMLDPCQLNPVNEKTTRILEMGRHIWLTEDMRSGNGPLLQVKRKFRDLALARLDGVPEKDRPIDLSTSLDEEESGVHFLVGKFFDDAMLDMFDSEQYRQDPNFVRALAWTNREVDRMNRIIRTRIYGKGCDPYVVGERVCVLTPVLGPNEETIFATDDEAIISNITVTTYTDHLDRESQDPSYKVWRVSLKDPLTGLVVDVPVIHEDSNRKVQRRLDFLSQECREKRRPWAAFWDFHDMFTRIRPAHALTVHKSQGQTFGCVFVNFKDIMKNKNPLERARLGYVAGSRPTTDIVSNVKTFY